MAAILKFTIAYVELAAKAVELRNKGYDRFRFEFFEGNKKFVSLRAWKYYKRPDRRRQKC